MSENKKYCHCGKTAEFMYYYDYAMTRCEYLCADCAVDYIGGFGVVNLTKTCALCGKTLQGECYCDNSDGYWNDKAYCSIECALLCNGYKKIENKEK